ncbi:MAG: pre-16S rRNA-processing nuclease YqgF [Negativicutes bacterium]|nr:pre-16S rRNA-processing nuclease YqgF [Negativicutes bacterium]
MIIAIDPGREKCGVAVVHRIRGAVRREIVKTSELVQKAAFLAAEFGLTTIVLGNRTSSGAALRELAHIKTPSGAGVNLVLIDEHRSSDQARSRYWRENPPRGLKRLIPTTMQVPPVPVDDYVAVILAERYFDKN